MIKNFFPIVHFYDQDFVDIYEHSWAWVEDSWKKGTKANGMEKNYFNYSEQNHINQWETILSTFFLVYSNKYFQVLPVLDNFYKKQEKNGAIRANYSEENGKPITTKTNPEAVGPPLFAWAEYNIYHKIGNKKRLKEIMPILESYFSWLESSFKDDSGLYAVPLEAVEMPNSPRDDAKYLIDFNGMMAVNALYMSALGDLLNDKEKSFKYKRHYFSIKTRINNQMWNEKEGFYFDLDKDQNQCKVKTIGGFWPLLAEIPNEEKANKLVAHLKNTKTFGTENPFPCLSADDPNFCEDGQGYKGSVFPSFTFIVIKGLEKYGRYEIAREAAIRHMYNILDTLHPESKNKGDIYEAYNPLKDGPAVWKGKEDFPRTKVLAFLCLSSITLMIENIIGLYISLPRKTVDWIIPTLEIMGIENLSLKRNSITILSNKSGRGWEIRLESEKLYYFTINIIGQKKKTLPIPSGKCSMLIDKL